MSAELALKLVPILGAYFTVEEFRQLAKLFNVKLNAYNSFEPKWLSIASELAANLEHGNCRRFVDSLLEFAEAQNTSGIAHNSFERQDLHLKLADVIADAKNLLETSAAPSEISVVAGNIFSAKSKLRELLETSTAEIYIVDPYIGVGTLDCLRTVTQPIRLLCGAHQNAVEKDFERCLAAFIAEGHQLVVKRYAQIHDRHLIFNDRCWLVGGSLKDAGRKPFNCIEIIDKVAVIADLENKWQVSLPFP